MTSLAAEPPIASDTTPNQPLRVHDPAIAREGDTYYVFSTGPGIGILSSPDLIHWQRSGQVFKTPLVWAQEAVPGFKDHIWAPDIAFFGGKWHLYYSVSTFGKNRSAIGVATNATLNPRRDDYRWQDEGLVLDSKPGDDYNAIDPNVVFDVDGHLWLAFGSFWSGIKLRRLDAATGKPSTQDSTLYALASRPRNNGGDGAVEAPFIVQRGDFYYLFVSFDACCRGVNSTYNIRVGRATEITGPYRDRTGVSMLQGGGTPLLATQGTVIGPGHCAVLRDGNQDYLVHHFYDAEQGGKPALQVHPLRWTDDGWPQTLAPLTSTPTPQKP